MKKSSKLKSVAFGTMLALSLAAKALPETFVCTPNSGNTFEPITLQRLDDKSLQILQGNRYVALQPQDAENPLEAGYVLYSGEGFADEPASLISVEVGLDILNGKNAGSVFYKGLPSLAFTCEEQNAMHAH